MLPLIVALFWLALLAPWAVVKVRNSRAEKSIDHFHHEHEAFSRQGYSVAPARRLDDAYLYEEQAYEPAHEPARSRPRLTVVHDDDTYSTLESRVSWDEWERDYDYDEPRRASHPVEPATHRYAAYASAPAPAPITSDGFMAYADVAPGVSMRVRRNRFFVSLGASAVVTTALDLLLGMTLLQYLAVLSWVALALYVAAALYAVSQGLLDTSSLLPLRRGMLGSEDAPAPSGDYAEEYVDVEQYADEYDSPAADASSWRREPRRYALG